MRTEGVNSNTCNSFQIFKTCLSLSNLSRYQKTAKTKTAVSKMDAVPKSIMGMASIFEDAFLTTLPHSEPQLSIKSLVDIVPFLLKIPREIRQGMVGLCACSQRVSQTKPNLLMNVIETQRACWPFHTLDILSFELVVGHEHSADAPCHQ